MDDSYLQKSPSSTSIPSARSSPLTVSGEGPFRRGQLVDSQGSPPPQARQARAKQALKEEPEVPEPYLETDPIQAISPLTPRSTPLLQNDSDEESGFNWRGKPIKNTSQPASPSANSPYTNNTSIFGKKVEGTPSPSLSPASSPRYNPDDDRDDDDENDFFKNRKKNAKPTDSKPKPAKKDDYDEDNNDADDFFRGRAKSNKNETKQTSKRASTESDDDANDFFKNRKKNSTKPAKKQAKQSDDDDANDFIKKRKKNNTKLVEKRKVDTDEEVNRNYEDDNNASSFFRDPPKTTTKAPAKNNKPTSKLASDRSDEDSSDDNKKRKSNTKLAEKRKVDSDEEANRNYDDDNNASSFFRDPPKTTTTAPTKNTSQDTSKKTGKKTGSKITASSSTEGPINTQSRSSGGSSLFGPQTGKSGLVRDHGFSGNEDNGFWNYAPKASFKKGSGGLIRQDSQQELALAAQTTSSRQTLLDSATYSSQDPSPATPASLPVYSQQDNWRGNSKTSTLSPPSSSALSGKNDKKGGKEKSGWVSAGYVENQGESSEEDKADDDDDDDDDDDSEDDDNVWAQRNKQTMRREAASPQKSLPNGYIGEY